MRICTMRVAIAAAVVALPFSVPISAQARPDFSGAWAEQPAAAAPGARGGGRGRGGLGSGWGTPLTIAQSASQLIVEYAFFARGDLQPPIHFVFAIDGRETSNRVTMGRGLQEQRSRVTWDGATLVVTTTHIDPDPAGGPDSLRTQVTRRLTLESPTSLVMETTRAGVMGGQPSTVRTVYTKQP
jgi:hypothetical protein